MLMKLPLPSSIAVVVVGIFLLATTTLSSSSTLSTAAQTSALAVNVAKTTAPAVSELVSSSSNIAETTTSPLPLQPPLNVTSTTTSSFPPPAVGLLSSQEAANAKAKASATKANEKGTATAAKHSISQHVAVKSDSTLNVDDDSSHEKQFHFDDGYSKEPSHQQPVQTPEQKSFTSQGDSGYIHFDITDEEQNQATESQEANVKQQKTSTVNEVLSNLFPNGFTDIFRFSYASEQSPTTQASPRTATTIKTPRVTLPPSQATTTTTTTTQSPPSIPQTFYSYETSVSKEYRRVTRPGHMEIVVEKVALAPRASSEEFSDGSNSISKDVLLRINRAAVDAPVLPSLLVEPNEKNSENKTQASFIILNDPGAEMVEGNSEEDNLIAESQNIMGHHVYQLLPEEHQKYNYKNTERFKGTDEQRINVHIVPDEQVRNAQGQVYAQTARFPSAESQKSPENHEEAAAAVPAVTQQLDHFQQQAEENFQQRHPPQEAPSRKFLRNFNPILSESASTQRVPKGNFHYELNTPQPIYQQHQQQNDDSQRYGQQSERVPPPAAQVQYLREQQKYQQQQQNEQPSEKTPDQEKPEQHQPLVKPRPSPLHTQITDSQPLSTSAEYGVYQQSNATPKNVVFVTLNTPAPGASHAPVDTSKTPHEYVQQAVQNYAQYKAPTTPKPQGGYTFVEVQKSVNIHNKLITEKDGKLIEQHETIYHQPQYGQRLPQYEPQAPAQAAPQSSQQQEPQPEPQHPPPQQQQEEHHPLQQQQQEEQHQHIEQQQPHHTALGATDYVSLSANPIHVQHIDAGGEYHEEAASHAAVQHVPAPLTAPQEHYMQQGHLMTYGYPYIIQQNAEPQSYAVQYPVQEVVEQPQQVEKHVHHHHKQVEVAHQAPVEHYIDRPYPVHEIIEKHVHIPYPVPEPVDVPVYIDRYIDRPYPVETIVEKQVPYPVETVVEKVVEKHVPVEVERIVEKPVEKLVEKFIDRPVPIPIHVPVAVPVYQHHHHPHEGHQLPRDVHFLKHPNALVGWAPQTPAGGPVGHVPPKVLQNYYTRMLKKLLPQMAATKATAAASAVTTRIQSPTKAPARTTKTPKLERPKTATSKPSANVKPFDIRLDLRPPPPPPLGPNWSKGARYIYNTLPQDLAAEAASSPAQVSGYYGSYGEGVSDKQPQQQQQQNIDEFQRWRNGPSLKRSPQFGRNLHVEYGFKPPLVPSLEIDDQGMPVNSGAMKVDE